jgi:hypothetical protein
MNLLSDALHRAGIDASTLRHVIDVHGQSIHTLKIDGTDAVPLWHRVSSSLRPMGFWPVIVREASELLESVKWAIKEGGRFDGTLTAAEAIDPPKWFPKQSELCFSESHLPPHGEWPLHAESAREILGVRDHQRRWRTAMDIWIVPASHGWQLPAVLQFGGWNDCPAPEVQVAVLRYWHERYGSELTLVGRDTLEFTVSRPPTTRNAAMALAEEQYAYCYDIVEQGVDTIEALAAILLHGRTWYFWWD